jgi:arylsulfatase A-like enzyme
LLPHLRDGVPLERETLIWHFPHYRHEPGPYSIIRQGDWKLIKFWEGTYELYDLEHDLGEAADLALAMPEKVEALDALLMEHLRTQGAKLPRPNPDHTAESK